MGQGGGEVEKCSGSELPYAKSVMTLKIERCIPVSLRMPCASSRQARRGAQCRLAHQTLFVSHAVVGNACLGTDVRNRNPGPDYQSCCARIAAEKTLIEIRMARILLHL